MNQRDNIYYNFIFNNLKPKKRRWKIYCLIRKMITIKESPSKVALWQYNLGDMLKIKDYDLINADLVEKVESDAQMTDKELDDYMKIVNPNFDSHIEDGTIEMSNEYSNLLEEKMARLINETQELKKQLEKYKKKLMTATKMEINEIDKNTFVGMDYFQDKCINYENQQKKFMKYLEDEIKLEIQRESVGCETTNKRCILEEILQKYKSIIGVKNESR